MLNDHWPLFGLRLTTLRLELRLPTDADLADLADLAVEGIHDPAVMPFGVAWTDLPAVERGRSVIQHAWRLRGSWQPQDWHLTLAVVRDGRVVGVQGMMAHDFGVLREVSTGSWVGLAHQGQGVGTEMRAAALHLAFAGLAADHAISAAFADNAASYRVSQKLGYENDGVERAVVRGEAVTSRRLRLTRERWEAYQSVPVGVAGLDPCRALFGV